MALTATSQRFFDSNTSPGIASRIGRGLFATADFGIGGDVLHIERPFLAVLETDRLDDTCAGCFGATSSEQGESIKPLPCSGCQVTKYCNKTCQAQDWNLGHRLECPIFKKLKPRILPINARAVLRIILRMSAPPRFAFDPDELNLFDQLESHMDEIRTTNAPVWERITLSSMAVKRYSGTEMELEEILKISAKLDVNSFSLTTAAYDRVGVYLHPYAAIMNHDCNYNAIVGFDGPEMYVKAIRPIKKDDQIFISYVDATNRFSVRNKELLQRFYFTCRCNKCLYEEGEPLELPGAVVDAYALLESDSASYEGDQLMGTITNLTDLSWSISEQPLVAIVDEYIATLLSENEIASALSAAALRYLHIDPDLYPEGHSLRVVHAWALANIALHASESRPRTVLKVYGGIIDGSMYQGGEVSVNTKFIAYSVLNTLVLGGNESCVVPGLKETIRRAYAQLDEELRAQGTHLREEMDRVSGDWAKLDRVALSIVGKHVKRR
ncbi:SET and MYND domain protein [Aspergillus pseudoustus]|uniref:SET and MYND domain protein n=1 Tax=Aspergillus pseudoustus TaxID=1810923 RepID=A0ABR4KWB4_9EURO